MAHQQHFEHGTVIFFGSKRFEVDGVSGEHEHEGGKTGQCYVKVTPGELRQTIGCSLMAGMRATFSPGPDPVALASASPTDRASASQQPPPIPRAQTGRVMPGFQVWGAGGGWVVGWMRGQENGNATSCFAVWKGGGEGLHPPARIPTDTCVAAVSGEVAPNH